MLTHYKAAAISVKIVEQIIFLTSLDVITRSPKLEHSLEKNKENAKFINVRQTIII